MKLISVNVGLPREITVGSKTVKTSIWKNPIQGRVQVSKLNLDGEIQGVLSSYGRVPGKLDFAHNIAVDSAGAIYVSEIKNWRVQKWAK